jgi:hypothetical protein
MQDLLKKRYDTWMLIGAFDQIRAAWKKPLQPYPLNSTTLALQVAAPKRDTWLVRFLLGVMRNYCDQQIGYEWSWALHS